MPRYDAIVLGLGAFGSAALYHLARSGAKALGIDRFDPPHAMGSTHGLSRITRTAIGEGVEYTPLALRSHQLWRQIEQEHGRLTGRPLSLLTECGCLSIIGEGGGAGLHGVEDFLVNIEKAATRHKIPHSIFDDGDAITRTFPQFRVKPGDRGFLDHIAGYVVPEESVRAQLDLARDRGAEVLTNTQVVDLDSAADSVTVKTSDGGIFTAGRILISAGAWIADFLPEALRPTFTVTRQGLYWFEIRSRPELFTVARCPTFIWDCVNQSTADRPKLSTIYGFPLIGDSSEGLKVTQEEHGAEVDPDVDARQPDPADAAKTYRNYLADLMPDLGPRAVRSAVCLYTKVDFGRFVIDRHPAHPRVMFASPCSGHGFKHSAAVGEALADTLMGQEPKVDLAPFTLAELERHRRMNAKA
jgi:sarcosine oxidase